jgi:polyribonucleotide nucleotidyltransferase
VLLTDIIGLEDFSGDMDFKVAGTDQGITAIQLDVKVPGLTQEQIVETLARARTARMLILEKMLAVIPASRAAVSEYAPKIELIQIPVDKIGEVIGPGGKNIKAIIAQTGADVDVEDDGKVAVSGISEEAVRKAVDWIKGITRDVAVGEVFEGVVKRMLPFGAFVEYLPGREGMVHVSKMRQGFVKDPSEVVSLGQTVKVKVEERDAQGRINLSMLFGEENEPPRNPGFENQNRGSEADENRGRPSFRPNPSRGRDMNRPAGRNDQSRPLHPLSQQLRRENSKERPRIHSKSPRKPFSR